MSAKCCISKGGTLRAGGRSVGGGSADGAGTSPGLTRRRGLFLSAATDDHGYAQAVCAWNLMRLPGWRGQDPAAKLSSLTQALRRGGFSAVTIAIRPRVPAASGSAIWLDPYLALWTKARSWTWPEALACLAWIWVLPMAFARFRW